MGHGGLIARGQQALFFLSKRENSFGVHWVPMSGGPVQPPPAVAPPRASSAAPPPPRDRRKDLIISLKIGFGSKRRQLLAPREGNGDAAHSGRRRQNQDVDVDISEASSHPRRLSTFCSPLRLHLRDNRAIGSLEIRPGDCKGRKSKRKGGREGAIEGGGIQPLDVDAIKLMPFSTTLSLSSSLSGPPIASFLPPIPLERKYDLPEPARARETARKMGANLIVVGELVEDGVARKG